MRNKLLIGGLLASVMIVPALAQSNPPAAAAPAPAATPSTTMTAPASQASQSGTWRASKLVGLNVYNDQNEKLGDITELLLDKSGKVEGVVIGVGGFLGMGQHDIKVEMSKLKFVDEPIKTTSTSSTTSTSGSATSTTGASPAATRPATTTTTTASSDKKWSPDHAVMSGASKDQLKSMTAFKYN